MSWDRIMGVLMNFKSPNRITSNSLDRLIFLINRHEYWNIFFQIKAHLCVFQSFNLGGGELLRRIHQPEAQLTCVPPN